MIFALPTSPIVGNRRKLVEVADLPTPLGEGARTGCLFLEISLAKIIALVGLNNRRVDHKKLSQGADKGGKGFIQGELYGKFIDGNG